MTNMILLPFLLPLFTGLVCLFWRHPSIIRRYIVIGSVCIQFIVGWLLLKLTLVNGPMSVTIGGWQAPFGIEVYLDSFSAIMVLLASIVQLISFIYRFSHLRLTQGHPIRSSLLQFMIAGTNLAFIAGDFFNLFVAYEIMLIASYAIFILDAKEGNIKKIFPYLIINLIGSALFLCAAAFCYSIFGTLNFTHIAALSNTMLADPRLWVLGVLILCVFGIKSGFFPLYYWLPNSYPILPHSTMAIFSATLTEVGLYSIIRIFGSVLPHNITPVYFLITFLAIPTMLFGVISALTRRCIIESLCLQIVCQIGFIMIAMTPFTFESLSACIFYMGHHILVVSSLLLLGGVIRRLCGTDHLDNVANLWKHTPLLGIMFLIQGFSLAGLPFFSGFWGKLWILSNSFQYAQYFAVIAMLLTSFLTMVNVIKIWARAFWRTDPGVKLHLDTSNWRLLSLIIGVIVIISLTMGLYPDIYTNISKVAAKQIVSQRIGLH